MGTRFLADSAISRNLPIPPEPVAFARFPRARHLRRAVLRPGIRIRGDAAVALAGRASRPRRRAADPVPAARGVVGVDVHLLVHQLGRPRQARGARAAVRAHARGPAVVGVDSECLRPRGAAVRQRLCVHARSSRTVFVLFAMRGHDPAQLPQFPAHHLLAGRCRACSGSRAAWAGGDARSSLWIGRAAHRMPGAVACTTTCRGWAVRAPRTGRSTARTWPNAARCSSSSRWANRFW